MHMVWTRTQCLWKNNVNISLSNISVFFFFDEANWNESIYFIPFRLRYRITDLNFMPSNNFVLKWTAFFINCPKMLHGNFYQSLKTLFLVTIKAYFLMKVIHVWYLNSCMVIKWWLTKILNIQCIFLFIRASNFMAGICNSLHEHN